MRSKSIFTVLILSVVLSACMSGPKKPLIPVHDEVLVYQLPYDLTYLRTLDALAGVSGWDLEITDKENGRIRVRNVDYTGFDNSDQRVAEFILKRVSRGQTSVELANESQQVLGAGDLIKAISAQLNREVAS